MRILGIDPGTGRLGFGVIEIDKNNNPILIDAGVITTTPHQPDSERMLTIFDELTTVISATKPDAMVVERLFFAQNVTTALSVAQARGVVLLCGQQKGLTMFEYTPLQIKMALTGYGRADKKQMQEMVRVILKLKDAPQPDDCADALAAAICHTQSVR